MSRKKNRKKRNKATAQERAVQELNDFNAKHPVVNGVSRPATSLNGKSNAATFERCYMSHPALEIGGGTLYGGNCHTPKVKDADIYIGLDRGAETSSPWSDTQGKYAYCITDMSVPKDVAEFRRMIEFVIAELAKGCKVHIGCIGGHGRTGLVFAALVNQINGEKDAIKWVRENYCTKAVESSSQIEFLKKHFGITPAKASKGVGLSSYSTGKYQTPVNDSRIGKRPSGYYDSDWKWHSNSTTGDALENDDWYPDHSSKMSLWGVVHGD